MNNICSIKEIAAIEELKTVTIIDKGTIFPALIGFKNWEDLEKIKSIYKLELETISIYQEKGTDNFWKINTHQRKKPFINSESEFGDGFIEITKTDFNTFFSKAVLPVFRHTYMYTNKDVMNISKKAFNLFKKVEKLNENEIILLKNYEYYKTMERVSIKSEDEKYWYAIALYSKDKKRG